MKYGLPYQGSKNEIAEWVIDKIPPADVFVDLFAGGCALTHAAMLSGKYKMFYANDITDSALVFKRVADNVTDTSFVSREDFDETKDTLKRIIFSFGTSKKSYIYTKDKERLAKAVHEACYDKKYDALSQMFSFDENAIKGKNALNAYLTIKNMTNTRCEHIERLERVKKIHESLPANRSESLVASQANYKDKILPNNCVVVCDIPYKDTAGYDSMFNHEEFYRWAQECEHPVYVCEYEMPDPFVLCAEKLKLNTLNAKSKRKKVERIYCINAKPYRTQQELFAL